MEQLGKQERSKKRIEVILDTAETILLEKGQDAITFANISKYSGLKRTSTYKFFPTTDALKLLMVSRYLEECENQFAIKSSNIKTKQLSVVVLRSVEILYEFFNQSQGAQLLILKNTITPSTPSKSIHGLSLKMQSFIELNINLPEMFNKEGVFRVNTQIILSIFALNTKESGSLNEVGKIEAHRASHAYLLNWVNQNN